MVLFEGKDKELLPYIKVSSAEINNDHSTYIFCEIIPLCNLQYRNLVRSITLIPFEIISQNMVEILSMTRRRAGIDNGHSSYILADLFPFVIFRIEIVSAL